MVKLYVTGKEVTDENSIHPNLLNKSVGPFPPNLKLKINYDIFDKSDVNLVEGKTYCISCKSTDNLLGTIFNGSSTDNDFLFYLYKPDHSQYFPVLGTKNGNSVRFKMHSGNWHLCVQYFARNTQPLSDFPQVEHVKIEEGENSTAWIPSSQDLADLASKLGGAKPSYRLYYAASVKEVA